MRTIEFRGKSIEFDTEGEWVYGDFVQHHDGDVSISIHGEYEFLKCIAVDIDTVGQFTGLFDKNGKEIYEGDIIGCYNPEIKHLIFYNENQGRFMAALNGDIENDFIGVCGLDDRRWMASKEVIGNVYDNPELVKSL